jgi:Ca2+-transporting ATPase
MEETQQQEQARAWHAMDASAVLAALGTDPESGISQEEARRRLHTYGHNALQEGKRKSALIRFLLQFNDFMIWVLIAAIIISGALLREYVDALVIFVIVLLNAVLGFVQETRAESALERLKELGAPTAKVVRGGSEKEIPARDLVPGDLMVLETGDAVTADARLVESVNLRANESSLTGESEAVHKSAQATAPEDAGPGDRINMVFSGTHVDYGRGAAVVVETGPRTEIGQIAGMLEEGKEEATPLQVELRDVGKRIVYACLIIVAVVFAVGLIRRNPVAAMLLFAVSLAVAAIPEGLPAIVTITLARGTQMMAKQHAIIRNLPAVETLGSANYICTDKTGTLTLNKMTVTDIVFADAFHCLVEDVLRQRTTWRAGAYSRMERAAALCNDARHGQEGYIGDSTEVALLEAAESGGLDKDELEDELPRVAEVPFDSDRKMMTTAHRDNGGFLVFSKGAAEAVLERCDRMLTEGGEVPLTPEARAKVLTATTELGSQALRTLAVAYRKLDSLPGPDVVERLEQGLVFLGAFAMKDPPRPEVLKALQECRRARIDVAMITGDHKATAAAVARELGILTPNKHLVEGHDLEKMTPEQLRDQVEDISVFARVSPRHKVKIVEALKARGHVVAMTGDGVNDAPALKRADIGIAMGITGTDVAKEASDMVLADDNFATIVSAVRQGRIIFANLKKFVYFLLSCNISEVLTVFISMIAGFPLPLVASQILWINLVTDGLPALALGVDPPETDVMEHPPRKLGENILAVPRQLDLLWQGLLITAGALASFILAHYWLGYSWADKSVGLDMARTVLFTTMVLAQVFHSYNLRSERKSIFSSWPWENAYLFGAFLISVALQLAVLYLPFMQKAFHTHAPSWQAWVLILACSLIPVLLIDRIKVLRK